ncbi:MAG: putative metalloprotease CJM1_0395 family protein [Gallionellaceae bacterium]
MEIKGLPPDPNVHIADTKLKLLAAARLPVNQAVLSRTEPLHAATEQSKYAAPKLSDEEQMQISKLKARDTQVRQHEQAHLSASGGLNVSGASYTYQKGPNGVNYAVAGDVKIDISPGRTPEETLARAEKITDAALAPADPSPVDRSVAASAQNMAQQARIELQQQESGSNSQKAADTRAQVSQSYENIDTTKNNIDIYA